MSNERQFCTFYVDDLYMGVAVEQVQEVIRFQEMTEVPLAPAVIRGMINLRGQIVTAIDLRKRLELPDRKDDKNPMNVIVRTDEDPVSFLVDRIGDVFEVAEEISEEPPEMLEGAAKELVTRVYKLEGKLLLILDAEKAMQVGMGAAA